MLVTAASVPISSNLVFVEICSGERPLRDATLLVNVDREHDLGMVQSLNESLDQLPSFSEV
jgi:hypothetical protein